MIGAGRKTYDAYIQDQTTDPIILRFNKITNSTTLAADIALHDRSITLASATGVAVGSYLILFNNTVGKVMPCVVTSIAGSPTFAIDRPADYAFPSGTNVDVTIVSMAQNGALAEQVFGLRGPAQPTAVDVSLDINEIRLFCIASSAVDLKHFGNIEALTNGVLVRSRNGGYKNIANMKSNAEILGAFGNWTPYTATNPAQGVDGFLAKLTFNGQDNLGVAKRLASGDDLEFVFNEDLTAFAPPTALLEAVAIGHVVDE